jgi:hypothetical protein
LPLLLFVHHQIAIRAGPAVTLPLGLLAELGIDPCAKSRGLHALEKAGVVRVTRERGCPARVALIWAETTPGVGAMEQVKPSLAIWRAR